MAPFGIEGGECLENNLDNLKYFINKGLFYLGPTWNYSNSLATSAFDETYFKYKFKSLGLSSFGKDVIRMCDESKVFIDVSHIGEKSFWDISKISSNPIIASHSCVYNLCNHYRNLKDEQINEIKRKKGVIFLNLYPSFFDPEFSKKEEKLLSSYSNHLKMIDKEHTNPDLRWINKQNFMQKKYQKITPELSKFIDHIDYIVKLAGVDYVGIGSDYDGIDCLPKNFIDCRNHMRIAEELDKRKYNINDIEKIMGLNLLRVCEEINLK